MKKFYLILFLILLGCSTTGPCDLVTKGNAQVVAFRINSKPRIWLQFTSNQEILEIVPSKVFYASTVKLGEMFTIQICESYRPRKNTVMAELKMSADYKGDTTFHSLPYFEYLNNRK